jgi:hypothetical protein
MVRLWVNDEDYGTMTEKTADLYLQVHLARYPEEPVRIEPVADDAPAFLDS